MKLAISALENGLDAPLDQRFGRASKFIIYDLENDTYEMVDNRQNLNAAQGAGVQSAELIARLGVKALLSGHCGPKAFRVLKAAGIKIFNTNADTVAAALKQYRAGELVEAEGADVQGHWI